MPKNKDQQKSGSQSSMGNTPDREFEGQGQNPAFGSEDQNRKAGGRGKGTGSQSNMEEDEMTAGGRKGNFSDTERENESQWSPGSNQPSER